MRQEIKIKIKPSFVKALKQGYPLIEKDAIANLEVLKSEDVIINLVDSQNKFIAKGYYGKQNKGYGWVLSYKENETIDEAFFIEKFKKAIQYRKDLYESKETTAFRMFNGEGDGVGGLTIDYFAGYYLVTWYSEGIYSFKDEVISALLKSTEVKGIYQKKRFDTDGKYIEDHDYVMGEIPEWPLIVKESGQQFAIYLDDGAMVGIFLDQREVRKRIRDHYAQGKTVLNTFSYTGGFSVFAAAGGASKTTSVDLANRSLSKTREQFSVNDIDPDTQSIIVEDVFKYFKYAVKKELKFDMVVLDPPSFARSKKFTFSASKDYTNLLKEAITITEKGGIIVASTNCSAFNMERFKGFIDSAFSQMGSKYTILEEYTLPKDFKTIDTFKEGNYLKVVFIKKH